MDWDFKRRTVSAPTAWIRNRRTKSIVHPARTVRPVSAHHFEFADGALAVDETKQRVALTSRFRLKKRLRPLLGRLGPLLRFIDPYSVTDVTRRTISPRMKPMLIELYAPLVPGSQAGSCCSMARIWTSQSNQERGGAWSQKITPQV